MPEDNITPKFLTKAIAEAAVARVLGMVMGGHQPDFPLKRRHCHVVVLAPSITQNSGWPNYTVEPFVLCERSVGTEAEWEHPYKLVAQRKAMQLWQERNDGRTDCMPHLLMPNDTPYWGGVKRDGIVVTCSGVQPWFDRMISGMVADACIALAYNQWMESEDRQQGRDFLF